MAGSNINPKAPPWYTGGLGGVMRPGASRGDVYYLDGNAGDNANTGRTPDAPFLTFRHALDQCTDWMDDYIIVLDYWNANGEAWPIDVNVNTVHIIGVSGQGATRVQVNPTGDFAAFSMNCESPELAYLSINGGANCGAVEIDAAEWGIEVHHCWFGEMGTAQDGIRGVAPFDAVYLKIWGCRFGLGLTRDGIRLDHNATRGMLGVPGLEPNTFRAVPGHGIYINNSFSQGGIYDNRFSVADAAAGEAILIDATCSGVNVDGNRAWQGQAAMTFNPYRDLGTNCWGENHIGIAPAYPVTV